MLGGWQEEALCPPVPHSDLPDNLWYRNLSLPVLLTSLAFCLPPFAEDEFLLGGEERAWLGGADHSRKGTSFSIGFLVPSAGSVWWLLP